MIELLSVYITFIFEYIYLFYLNYSITDKTNIILSATIKTRLTITLLNDVHGGATAAATTGLFWRTIQKCMNLNRNSIFASAKL